MSLYRIGFVLFLFVLLLSAGSTPLQAQDAPAVPSDVTADEVNEIARELWCPLCSGVRLDGCELRACDQMKEEIAIKLGEGEDLAAIKQYFVNQYGPQVLGEPPREGFNLLAWILPILVLIGGGVFLIVRGRAMLRPPDDDPVAEPGSAAADAMLDDTMSGGDEGATDPAGEPVDPYARRLNEELSSYD